MKKKCVICLFLSFTSLLLCEKDNLFKECDQNIFCCDSLTLICRDNSKNSSNEINSSL